MVNSALQFGPGTVDTLGGIGAATFGAFLVYELLRGVRRRHLTWPVAKEAPVVAPV
jgi:hypothetical protein